MISGFLELDQDWHKRGNFLLITPSPKQEIWQNLTILRLCLQKCRIWFTNTDSGNRIQPVTCQMKFQNYKHKLCEFEKLYHSNIKWWIRNWNEYYFASFYVNHLQKSDFWKLKVVPIAYSIYTYICDEIYQIFVISYSP